MTGDSVMGARSDGRRRVRVIAFVAVGIVSSALFLWLVLREADLDAVWRALRAADSSEILLAALVMQAVYVAQAARWRLIAGTPQLSLPGFYALVLGGIGANNVLPLRIGDLLRGRWLASRTGIPTGTALGSVFRDRACDVLVLVVALVVSIALVGDAAWVARIMLGGLVLVAVLAIFLLAAVVYTRTRPRVRLTARGRIRRFARDTIDEVASPIGRRRLAWALVLSCCAWGAWALAAALVASSLGIHLSVAEAVFVTAVVNLGVAIPSSPGFVGTYQWLAVAALGVVGVDGDVAIAFALLMQAVWFIPTTLAGGVIAVREVHRDAVVVRARTETPVAAGAEGHGERS
jgi:uncharacterized protein (TIRG00374 family)